MLDRYRGFPNVMIQHFFKVDVIMFIQSKWISNYICNFHPGIDKNYFHNLVKWEPEENDACTVLKIKVLFCKCAQENPGEDGDHKCLTVDQRKWVVLISCHIMKFRLKSVQLRDEILLILNCASLTTSMICIDKRNRPCQRNPPLILPIRLLSCLKNQVKKCMFI